MPGKKLGVKPNANGGKKIIRVDSQSVPKNRLTRLEKQARREAAQSIRVASFSNTGGFSNINNANIKSADFSFYSPQLSTDFLEQPQSEREKRELFRFWYTKHPIVGAAIDFHCFPPGAPVMMKDGSVNPIESLNVGDEVINGLGESTKVVRTFKHDICDEVIRLKVRGIQGNIDCTGNHPFLVYRAEQVDCKFHKQNVGVCKSGTKFVCKQNRCSGFGIGEPQFVFAKDLKIGDYICSPSMVSSKSVFSIAQLRLLGYYAAEGSLSRTEYGKLDRVVFTLNINEFDTIANEITEMFDVEYNHRSRKYIRKDCNACEIRCYKNDFAEFCFKHVGSGSHNKKLSQDIIDSPREDILEFLGAYWNGDGSLTKNGYVATTVSKQLAHQIYALALKVGFAPTLHSSEPKQYNTGFKSNGPTYRIIIPYRFYTEFSKYANFVRGNYSANTTREYCVRIGSNTLRKIEKAEAIQYTGSVYNIEVDGEGKRKSYVAYGLATHNTDVPMSKIRLSLPKGKDQVRNRQILHFFEQMCTRIKLFQTLYDATHEYWLQGMCCSKSTLIRTSNGVKQAKNISVNDRLLTNEGRFKRVKAVFSRESKFISNIKINGLPDSVGFFNHPIEVYRNNEFVFVDSESLNSNDYVRVTWPTEFIDIDTIKLIDNDKYTQAGFGYSIRRKKSNNKISNDEIRSKIIGFVLSLTGPAIKSCGEFAKEFKVGLHTITSIIAGLSKEVGVPLYVKESIKGSQGSKTVWNPLDKIPAEWFDCVKSNGTFINFPHSLNVNDKLLYVIGYWLSSGRIVKRGGINYFEIKCVDENSSNNLNNILTEIFGDCVVSNYLNVYIDTNKNPIFVDWALKNLSNSVPEWIVVLPIAKQKFVLQGMIDACNKTNNGFAFNKRNSAILARDIFFRLGKIPSLKRDWYFNRHQYTVNPNGVEDFIKIGDSICFKIESVTTDQSDIVYNFEVEDDHTYQAGFISTHNCYIFAEDHDIEIPDELLLNEVEEEIGEIDEQGILQTRKEKTYVEKSAEEQIATIKEYVIKNYQGWQRLRILPPEQIRLEVFQYTDKVKIDLIPSDKDRLVVMKAMQDGDEDAVRIAEDIPEQIRENLESGKPIPLNTSPYDDYLCSSFVYHLAHKKSAYDDRGVSLIERCHLPGTEVTARRNGQILQVPIEKLNPETDEVLGGSGHWRKFQCGQRSYDGKITGLNVHKLPSTIWSTSDHKLQILRQDELIDTEAIDVMPGDYLKVVSVKSEKLLNKFDLFTFFQEEEWVFRCRRSQIDLPLFINVEESGDDTLVLHYLFNDKNPQRISRKERLYEICDWIKNLEAPIEITSSAFISKFDLSDDSVYKSIISDLESLGYAIPCIKSDLKYKPIARLFRPAHVDPSILYEIRVNKICPRWLDLNGDLGYLVGYYLGDGWTETSKPSATKYGPSGICWQQDSENSQKSAEHIFNIAENLGLNISCHNYELGWMHFHDDWFSRWIGRSFGHNKNDKCLPEWINETPESFKFGILRGLIDSDGSVSKGKYNSNTINISVTTKNLVQQLFIMCTGLGLSPSYKIRTKTKPVRQANGTYCKNPKPLHTLNFSIRNDVASIKSSGFTPKLSKFNVDPPCVISLDIKSKNWCGNTYYKVKEVLSDRFSGDVFSLNVEVDHTFFAGFSLTKNCLHDLIFSDKLRQAQTSIASRAMTPKRVVWADKMSTIDTDDLRDQVDQALIDPDFSIVTNFEVHWDEIGSRDRLLDLSSEYEITNKRLFIGLRVTEPMLTGESTYAGERIHLDVMNTMYLLYRESLAEYVEQYLFAPVAHKKGFYETDEFGNRILLFPKLQFTRLALRDNTELQDFMFNLYQKGSLPIDYILELINIDTDDVHARLKSDMFTPKDAVFNEVIRKILEEAATSIVEKTDVVDRLIKNMGLTKTGKDGGDRFGE